MLCYWVFFSRVQSSGRFKCRVTTSSSSPPHPLPLLAKRCLELRRSFQRPCSREILDVLLVEVGDAQIAENWMRTLFVGCLIIGRGPSGRGLQDPLLPSIDCHQLSQFSIVHSKVQKMFIIWCRVMVLAMIVLCVTVIVFLGFILCYR